MPAALPLTRAALPRFLDYAVRPALEGVCAQRRGPRLAADRDATTVPGDSAGAAQAETSQAGCRDGAARPRRRAADGRRHIRGRPSAASARRRNGRSVMGWAWRGGRLCRERPPEVNGWGAQPALWGDARGRPGQAGGINARFGAYGRPCGPGGSHAPIPSALVWSRHCPSTGWTSGDARSRWEGSVHACDRLPGLKHVR